MTAEAIPQNRGFVIDKRIPEKVSASPIDLRKKLQSFTEYNALGPRPASSKHEWYLPDWINSKLARVLHLTDEDLRKKTSG